MKPKIKKLWLEALRSGKYKQGKDYLHNQEGEMCCLGVLVDIYRKTQKKGKWVPSRRHTREIYEYRRGDYSERTTLPYPVRKWAGLGSSNPSVNSPVPTLTGKLASLAQCNDKLNQNFNQIADLIEKDL